MSRYIALALLIGIIGLGAILDWIETGTAPVTYASEPEPPRVVMVRAETPEEKITRLILAAFPEEPRMLQVAECESGLIPSAVSHTNDHGLFQLNSYYHDLSEINPYDIEDNIRFARKLYNQSGLAPWKASFHCWSK